MAHSDTHDRRDDEPGEEDETPPAHALTRIFEDAHADRLTLRRPRIEDAPDMFRIHGDPATNRYDPAGPLNQAESEAMLRIWLQQWQDNGYGYWAVTLPHSAEIIGFGGVRRMVWRDRDALNLAYRFAPSAWGHGYATEVARIAVSLARKRLPSLPIVALIHAENVASIRTAERAGLLRRPDLDTADHRIFALGWPPASPSPE